MCVKLRPEWLPTAVGSPCIPIDSENPGFVIHPSTSELAEQLMVDPTALSNENYSGIFDESGDYIPQYCDDPEKVPRGAIDPNPTATAAASAGVATGPDDGDSSADHFKSDSDVE